jgi:hypothetical protein
VSSTLSLSTKTALVASMAKADWCVLSAGEEKRVLLAGFAQIQTPSYPTSNHANPEVGN